MEGKQEDRASPLDFPSAALAEQRRRRLAQERFEQNISPPTIPRSTNEIDTNRIFHGWQNSGSIFSSTNSATSEAFIGAAGGGISASTGGVGNVNAPSLNSFRPRPATNLRYGGRTSAFSSSRLRQSPFHGQIQAYQQRSPQDLGQSRSINSIPSELSTLNTRIEDNAPLSWFSEPNQREQHQDFAPRQFVASGSFPAPLPPGGQFFTPLPAAVSSDHLNLSTAGSSNSLDRKELRQMSASVPLCLPVSSSSQSYRPHSSGAGIQTMGSIDESVSSSGDFASLANTRSPYRARGRASRNSSRSSQDRSVSSGRSSRSKRGRNTPVPSTVSRQMSEEQKEGGGGKSPPPQNLRGDPFRSAKVKTELCRNFNSAKGCPFGDKCNYAHGANELKFTKLMDLERAGLLDVEIFRTHPCPTWVATGSCPFDQRCIGLHDPRVEGNDSSWLPHAETMINKVADGTNVDSFYHERVASVYNNCPIYGYVPQPGNKGRRGESSNDASFKHFYEFVCNADRFSISKPKHVFDKISEEVQLQIILKMREEKTGCSYHYMPTHLLQGELCMVLQAKTFESRLENHNSGVSTVVLTEIDPNCLQKNSKSMIIKAHEIAFGPVGDSTVRSVSTYFDLPDGDLVDCTPQQAKHHKRSRHRLNKKVKSSKIDEDSSKIPPFYNFEPRDNDTFDLVTRILKLRLETITLLTKTGNFIARNKQQVILRLESEMNAIKSIYLSLLQHWITFSWPDQMLEGIVDDETDVPPVDGEYHCRITGKSSRGGISDECHGLGTKRGEYKMSFIAEYLPALIWRSFVINVQIARGIPIDKIQSNTRTDVDEQFCQLSRLPTLQQLSRGGEICKRRNRPHVKNASQLKKFDIEVLLENWDSTKHHYKDNIENAAKRSLLTTSKRLQEQEKETIARTLSKYLDANAKQTVRTF